MGNKQREAFYAYEADAWFERNLQMMKSYSIREDLVADLIEKYNIKPKSILEIGCSAGYRLDGLRATYPGSEVFGIEPSAKAIEYGKEHYPHVAFHFGAADNLSPYGDESMSLVIVGFVFYVIDRESVFRVVSEIDRVLQNHGILIIHDFFAQTPLKNEYHHITAFKAFSFKQNYEEIFTSSRMYQLLHKSTFDHTTKMMDSTEDYHNKCSVTLLKKDIDASYR